MFCEGFCGVFVNILLIIAVVLGLHYVYLLWNSDYWKKRGVFCPDSSALLGNLPGSSIGKRNIMYDIDDLYQEYKGKHSCIGIFQFRQPRLLVLDPELIKDIMIKYFKYFQGTELYGKIDEKSDPLFGNHPFFLVGEAWKKKRAEVSPAFTNNRLKATFPVTTQSNKKLIDYIKKENANKNHDGFDAKNLAARFTIDVVSNSIYNVDPKSFEDEDSFILKTAQNFIAPTNKLIVQMLLTTVYPFLNNFMKFSFAQAGAVKFFQDLVKNAIDYRTKHNVNSLDFLDYLMILSKKKEISDADLASHGASFLVDGFETSSAAISAALYEIAKNKSIQDKLRQEINEAIPNAEALTYDAVMNLPYLDQIWNESLRIHGPVKYLSRYCNESVEIELPKGKKLFMEKGSVVFIPNHSIQMDAEYFSEPETFDPERFSPETGGMKEMMERALFMPFGIGPRICVGNRFAYSQAKIAIAEMIRNFEVSVNAKTPEKFEVPAQAIVVNIVGCFLDFKEIKKA